MRFNQQLLVTYECVNAVGISLNLEEMLNHFLRIFVRKSEALAGGFWVEKNSKYILACGQGKKDIFASIEPIGVEESWEIVEKNEKEKILFVRIGGGIMSFMFILNDEEIELVESILRSLYTKLDNAINACLNHEQLLMLNTKLQEQVNEEVEKNRQKDKHILQQSRLAQMGEMISMIAHQWRQPLGSISAVTASVKVKILLKKFDLTEEKGQEEIVRYLLESVDKIEHYVKFLSTTIDDFRNFFKPEKRKETVTLKDLIDRAFLVAGKALEVNGIALHRDEKSKRELTLYSNETMQVILNLIKNAEDALKERDISKKKIWIRTYDRQQKTILEVEDNAGGVGEEIIEKIFEPYFSTKTEKNGTGLGLYMCKTIVEEHLKGEITVENREKGACFKITLRPDKIGPNSSHEGSE